MQKTYWTLYAISLLGILFSIAIVGVVVGFFIKKHMGKPCFIISLLFSIVFMFICLFSFIPCVQDYKIVKENSFLEDDALMVEFTYVREDLDGNGQRNYAKPKFYIESKNEYVILKVKDVEIGKKYRIRYYPHTKICEILYCVEERRENTGDGSPQNTGDGSLCSRKYKGHIEPSPVF